MARGSALRSALLLAAIAPCSAQGDRPAVGAVIGDLSFVDIRYLPRQLSDFGERNAYVLFFTTVSCPVVQRYLPRLDDLDHGFRGRGVQFLAVNVGPGDSVNDMAAQGAERGMSLPFVKDEDLSVALAVGAERSATAIVLDADRRLRYRGRVDRQYRLGGVSPRSGRSDLRAAIDDVLADRAVRVPETAVEGCMITAARDPEANDATFARDVAPILQRHCQDCHRPDGEAPFELLTYADFTDNAGMIGEVVAQRRMPPWFGSSEQDEFVNHRGLDDVERRTLLGYLQGDMPIGDAADSPEPRRFRTGAWRIDEPDLVLKVPAPVRLPADGYVPYKYFVLPYRFAEDTYIEQIEILPQNRRVLHHANLIRFKATERPSQDGFVTGQVPGGDAMILDPGTAVKIPKGSALAIQAHYVTTGKPEIDRLRVGLRFPRVRVDQQLRVMIVSNRRFEIPARAEGHPVKAARRFDAAARGLGIVAHMHLRGRDMVVRAEYPDGLEETLLLVPNYSFDWQQSYRWSQTGKRLPAGTRIRVTAHYDNSEFNPFNPDPDKPVRFGLSTLDEMMYTFLFYVHEAESLDLQIDPETGRVYR